MFICFCTVEGGFHTTMAGLNSSKRYHMAPKARYVYSLALYGKRLLTLALEHALLQGWWWGHNIVNVVKTILDIVMVCRFPKGCGI